MRELLIALIIIGGLAYAWNAYTSDSQWRGDSSAPAPLAAQLSVEVVRTRVNAVYLPQATVRVRNRSAQYVDAYVDCTFYDAAGAVVATGQARPSGIAPGGEATDDATSADQYAAFERVECRVSQAWQAR